jgi:hypothetical protein
MASRLTSLHHRPLKSQPSIPLTQCVKQNDQSRFFRLLVLPQISSVSKDRGRRPQRQAAAERISPRLSLRSHWHEASDPPQHSEMRLDVLTVEECSHIDGSTLTTVFPGSALGPVARGSGYATIGVSRDRCPFAYFGRQWTGPEGCIYCARYWNASARLVSFAFWIPWSAQLSRPEVSGSECCAGGKDFGYAETRGDTPVHFLAIHPTSQACPCLPRFKP